MYLIDTDVAVYLRDGSGDIGERIAALSAVPALSLISWVELEGGVHAVQRFASYRRAALDALLARIDIMPFDRPVVIAYRHIVSATGFSRPRILDRLIAATAIVHDLTLITMNGEDFRDISGLKWESWAPAQ